MTSENRAFPIKKWKYGNAPPVSVMPYRHDVTEFGKERITGLMLKRLSSPFAGNYKYLTTNGRLFDNYYEAYTYQSLLNMGYCESDIDESMDFQNSFTFSIDETNRDFQPFYTSKK